MAFPSMLSQHFEHFYSIPRHTSVGNRTPKSCKRYLEMRPLQGDQDLMKTQLFAEISGWVNVVARSHHEMSCGLVLVFSLRQGISLELVVLLLQFSQDDTCEPSHPLLWCWVLTRCCHSDDGSCSSRTTHKVRYLGCDIQLQQKKTDKDKHLTPHHYESAKDLCVWWPGAQTEQKTIQLGEKGRKLRRCREHGKRFLKLWHEDVAPVRQYKAEGG